MKRLNLIAGLAIIIAFLVIPVLYYMGKEPLKLSTDDKVGFGFSIKESEPNAFGSLALNQSTDGEMQDAVSSYARIESGGGDESVQAIGMGGGGGVAAPMMATNDVMVEGVEKIMIAPAPTYYKFVYNGDELNLTENEMEVLKRIKEPKSSESFVSAIKNMNLDLVDIGSFHDMKVQNINFLEDRDFGYAVYINLLEGSININQNWQRWKHPNSECRDRDCYESFRLKESDMLSDAEVISISDNWMTKYNVSTDIYGKGEIDNDWRIYYARAENKSNYYFPEQVSVIYPLIINDKIVYTEGGRKNGLQVSVDIRQKKVSNMNGLASRQYESSMYKIETNEKKILSFVERGGWNRRYSYYMEENPKAVEVPVGEPELAYINMWQHKDNESTELLVPALVFPVLKVPEGVYVYEKNIIVPLTMDILGEIGRGFPGPIPMPLIEPAIMDGEEAVSGSSGSIDSVDAVEIMEIEN